MTSSPVYLEFLSGKRELTCTAWGNPTRNVKGWKGPCYLITDEHHETFDDLMDNTEWENYGYGKDPRCEHCMVHCGYEVAAALGVNGRLGDSLKMLHVATDVNLTWDCGRLGRGIRAAETAAAPGIAVLFALEREAAPRFACAARGLAHVSIHVTGVGRERAPRRDRTHPQRSRLSRLCVIAAGFCGRCRRVCESGMWSHARILTVDHLVSDPSEKRRLGQLHGATRWTWNRPRWRMCAPRQGVAFLAVRAVSDTVDTALSPELVRLLAGGNVSVVEGDAGAGRGGPALLGEFRLGDSHATRSSRRRNLGRDAIGAGGRLKPAPLRSRLNDSPDHHVHQLPGTTITFLIVLPAI